LPVVDRGVAMAGSIVAGRREEPLLSLFPQQKKQVSRGEKRGQMPLIFLDRWKGFLVEKTQRI